MKNLKNKLLDNQLSLAEWHVLATVGYGPIPCFHIADQACADSIGDPNGTITRIEAQDALKSLLERNYVQIINEISLCKILENHKGKQNPCYGFPQVGDLDFTKTGAEVFVNLVETLFGKNYSFKDKPNGVEYIFWWSRRK